MQKLIYAVPKKKKLCLIGYKSKFKNAQEKLDVISIQDLIQMDLRYLLML